MSTTRLQLAHALSEHYHVGQFYGGNRNYFHYHILGVVNQLKVHEVTEDILIVAYLHDIVEDTSCTIETIKSLFGEGIAHAVLAITKVQDESKNVYLARVAKNKLARVVKLHDTLFNISNCLKDKNMKKYNEYLESLPYLKV